MSARHDHRRRRPMRRLACVAAATASLLVAAPIPLASAKIAVGQGIAGVRIGDSMSRVRQLLGAPAASQYTSHGEWMYSSSRPLGGFVGFRAGAEGHERITSGVTYVQTSSHTQRTRAGVGPGSSYNGFRRAYPGYHCDRLNGPGTGVRACWEKTRYDGQEITTAFYFDGGTKVAFVVVAGQSYQLRAEFAL